jgi:site-specific DNA recombinase
MRIAIYARYSSDHQDERSIEDQIRLCRERACAIGANVVGTYTDYAISGAHLKSRPDASRFRPIVALRNRQPPAWYRD